MRLILFSLILLITVAAGSFAQVGPGPTVVLGVVNQIEFGGNTVISDEELRETVAIEPGELLTTPRLERAIAAIEQAYRNRGYLAVVADDIVAGFRETGTLTLPVVEVRVAEVRLEGLKKTRESAIRRLLELRESDLYNVLDLRRDAERLDALGVFESIEATLEEAEDAGLVIVVWQFEERAKTGYVTLGGSYSAQDNLIGSVVLVQSNFRGRAEQLRLSTSVGSIEGRVSWELFYLNPWVARATSLTFRAFNRVQYRFSRDLVEDAGIDRYFERRRGAQIAATRALSNVRRVSLGARYESLSVSNLPLEFLTPDIPSSDGTIVAVPGELVVDRRDSIGYPTRGYLWRAGLEPGRVDLDEEGTNWIAKGTGEFQRYLPLDQVTPQMLQEDPQRRPRVIALRFRAGTSVGDLPFFEQYFLGGLGGLRGYLEGRFWGKHTALAVTEYRHPIGSRLTGIAFVDAGDAWGSDFQFLPDAVTDFRQHDGFSPRAGAGVGIRYTTPFGSLGLDFAWGEEFRTHLVLGQTF